MTREDVQTKARRLLVEARLIVTAVNPTASTVNAIARGEGHLYRMRYDPLVGWSCSCPNRSDRCSHLLALRSIVAVDLREGS